MSHPRARFLLGSAGFAIACSNASVQSASIGDAAADGAADASGSDADAGTADAALPTACPSSCTRAEGLQQACDECVARVGGTCASRYPGQRLLSCVCPIDASAVCVAAGGDLDSGFAMCCP